MPAKTARIDLKGYDVSKELAAHANDEIKYGRVELPHGIKDGVAVLEECYFALGENGAWKGKPYLRAMGTVIEPEYHNGKKVAGLQTSIMVALFEQGETSKDENVERVRQELGKLGGPEAVKGLKNGTDLAAVAAALEVAKPMFQFTTTPRIAQKDDPDKKVKKGDVTGVWENWHGTRGLENYTPPGKGKAAATKDGTAEVNGKASTGKTAAKAEFPDTVSPDELENSDLEALLVRANNQDKSAKDRLEEMAIGVGYTEQQVNDADSWEQVLEMIRGGGPGTSKEKEPEKFVPKVGDECMYAPPGKKKGSKLDPVLCKVASVDESDSTVNLVGAKDKKVKFSDIAWDELVYG